MPVYTYKSIDPKTSLISEGKVEALDLRSAKMLLREQGKLPTSIEEDKSSEDVFEMVKNLPLVGQLLKGRIGLKDMNIFAQQLSTLIDSGIPLIESLYMLEQQTMNTRMRDILQDVRGRVIAGESFSAALGHYKDFSSLFINMIKAGEVSGELDVICKRLASLLEKYMHLQSKVQTAMIYPGVTTLIIVGVVVLMLVVVVPQFENVFASKGAQLPLPTVILMLASDFIINFWWACIGFVIAAFVGFNYYRLGPGKPVMDAFFLKIPVFGTLLRKVAASRFIRTLATLFASGASLVDAIEVSAATIDNVVMLETLSKAKESVILGGTLSRPLEQANIFPLMVIRMLGIAEQTGEMDKMLNKAADFLDLEVDAAVEAMTTLIEPAMIVILGTILLGIALALYLPLFDLGNIMSS